MTKNYEKTYVTSMPNHIGAFLKASRLFASLSINITRVSYNKAVDFHTLFIDAEGTENQLKKADEELEQIGFFDFGKLHFKVYEGKGGHLPGEIVFIDYAHHIAFTGDIYINFYDEKFALFNVNAKEDLSRALAMAEEDAKNEAIKNGLLELAEKQSETLIKGILSDSLSPLGYTVEIQCINK